MIHEALTSTEYWREGYLNHKTGEVNYFRYNNAFLDERIKMLYTYPALLHKAYKNSGAFIVASESEYAAYSDEEKQKLRDRNVSKAERAEILNTILKRQKNSESGYDKIFIEELKKDYSLTIFTDKGYISQSLFEQLFVDGIHLVTKPRKNMKNSLMHQRDKILLRKRFLIETVNDQLKNICQVEHTRHRSVSNFLTNMVSALMAYSFLPKKPSLNLESILNNQLDTAA